MYDQAGKVVARLGLNREGAFTALIAPSDVTTFYARFGDLFAWLNVAVTVGMAGFAYRGTSPAREPDSEA